MRVYCDTSALIKRMVLEDESMALTDALDTYNRNGDVLCASTLAWVEMSRALRDVSDTGHAEVAGDVEDAMSGVHEQFFTPAVTALARRVRPNRLRSLDAIHVASALVLDADVVLTYDDRLAEACVENGLRVATPGREE
jgi:uncharacterized protein